jgi:phosphoglycolate phosphatase-like HAD superfamily hydrolase
VPNRAGIAGVLFDVDGTLVDTTFIHATCWAEAFRQHGHVVTGVQVHRAIGMSSGKLLDAALGDDRDTSDDDAIVATHRSLYKQYWGRLNPFPRAADLLRTCHGSGLSIVLASSAKADELTALRGALDADEAIDATTSSSDAEEGKPEPDIVQVALDQCDLAADRAIFVGDAVWDGYATQRAGVAFVGLTCGGTPEDELREAGAIEVWAHPAELLDNLAKSVITTGRAAE